MATAYRPKGDSILYAISPNITRSYSILSDESPLQDLSVVANDHCPSHYQSSQSPSLSYVASLGPPRSRVLLAARAPRRCPRSSSQARRIFPPSHPISSCRWDSRCVVCDWRIGGKPTRPALGTRTQFRDHETAQ